ncbi:MAG: hypothetical protein FWD03_03095 [Defluviitaleaceae bacterium]|nr:hypothetical protein [Defluviitaleaceae bacterium]
MPQSKTTFTQKLLIFISTIFTATLAISLFSWLAWREIPIEIMLWVSSIFGLSEISYLTKSCIENKAKIQSQIYEHMHRK